jgi:BirA family biotin operon repressor/biotin-[acetyl-CoA-carboxylase] ligase
MPLRADLEIAAIADALGDQSCQFDVDLLEQCESTNSLLLARAEAGATSGSVIVARHQTAGRGRRGRAWISEPGQSLTFSLLWRLPPDVAPTGLSLATGLAVIRAINRVLSVGSSAQASVPGADAGLPITPRLKWPNDILLEGRKLGGILVELLPGTTHAAVIGCGLNLSLPEAMPMDLRKASASLSEAELRQGVALNPNVLLAAILVELLQIFDQFARDGFASLQDVWMINDAYSNQGVRVFSEFAPPVDGICRGVFPDGSLRLEVDGEIRALISGEVSLRLAT